MSLRASNDASTCFPFEEPSTLAGYDALIAIEDKLIKRLPAGSALDGHDSGMDEFNIFIHNSDPQGFFKPVCDVIACCVPDIAFSAGFRSFA